MDRRVEIKEGESYIIKTGSSGVRTVLVTAIVKKKRDGIKKDIVNVMWTGKDVSGVTTLNEFIPLSCQ